MATIGMSTCPLRLCQELHPGKVGNLLAAGREHGAETDVVRPGRYGGKRFSRVMGRDADQPVLSQSQPGCSRIAVILAEMNAIGIKGSGKRNIVINDKQHARLPAETAQLRAETEFLSRVMLSSSGTARHRHEPGPR